MSNLQQKLTELLNEMQNQKVDVDYPQKLSEHFAEQNARLVEIARAQKELNETAKETLRYSDMNLTNILDEMEEYISLEKEAKRILADFKRLQNYNAYLMGKGE